MKRIAISLKCGESVNLIDQEDTPNEQLLEQLSSLFSINSVSILKTKTTSVIIRPSDISSIAVEDVEDVEVSETEVKEEDNSLPQKIKSEQPVDIITDMD